MGHIITPDSLQPHDAKVKLIMDMPPPEDKQGLQRLLGMTKYLTQYIPNKASLKAPLRQLLRKDAVWEWNPHHSAALESLKTTLTKSPVLRFYDHKKLNRQTHPKTAWEPVSCKRDTLCVMHHEHSPILSKDMLKLRKSYSPYSLQQGSSISIYTASQ